LLIDAERSVADQTAITVCVCTFNSAETLEKCLVSIQEITPASRLLVVDHCSKDGSLDIAKKFGAEIFQESKGLGYARQLCLDLTKSEYIAFVDGDVELVRKDFFMVATKALDDKMYGAVVGMALGHKFAYGLPASLLVLRKNDFLGEIVPDYIDARETFFIQKRLDHLHLKTRYVFDSMVHRSQFRNLKPEWEGANTRILPGTGARELLWAFKVILLLSLNSRSVRNIAYIPIFYLKFLRGFAEPAAWVRIDRTAK